MALREPMEPGLTRSESQSNSPTFSAVHWSKSLTKNLQDASQRFGANNWKKLLTKKLESTRRYWGGGAPAAPRNSEPLLLMVKFTPDKQKANICPEYVLNEPERNIFPKSMRPPKDPDVLIDHVVMVARVRHIRESYWASPLQHCLLAHLDHCSAVSPSAL